MADKIVITGISAVTPLGNNLNEITKKMKDGITGIGYINRYNFTDFPVKHGGTIDLSDLDKIDYPYKENLQFKLFYYCLHNLYNNFKDSYQSERIACMIGTNPNIAALEDVEFLGGKYMKRMRQEDGVDIADADLHMKKIMSINPSLLLYYASKDFHINGPCLCNFGTCSASTQAIGDAYRLLKSKKADLVVCGGISMNLDPIAIARLCRLNALEHSKDDVTKNCSPFDKHRKGFTIGEGSILFTLEREEDAKKRKAEIYAEIKGYGAAMDGFSLTDPREDALGMSLSMERALTDAGLKAQDIDYINAHGTGTRKNDKCETLAIKKVFKEYASQMDISSTKSMHGHLLTAGGAMEVLVSILSIHNGFVPPTINYETEDPECDLSYTPNRAKTKKIVNVLTNSFGLGGINASLVVSKY